MLRVLVAKETTEGETRVSATPETIKGMVKKNLAVTVESGAGAKSFISDDQYKEAGAEIATDAKAAWAAADIVIKVRPPENRPDIGDEAAAMKDGAIFVGFVSPFKADAAIKTWQAKKVTSLPMELVPRITRAQKMDALSSQASIAGYKAVLVAAERLPKYFPLLMTAAGTVKPARVVIMGAGVAGLQAIATAKRLGAIVEASDIRPEVAEQIESLGGKFIPLPETGESGSGKGGYAKEMTKEFLQKQQEIVGEHIAEANVVITTALIPGRPAPKLVPEWMVQKMRPGGVIVDLAVEQGGNCELSELDKEVTKHGILIVGHPNLPATMPADASMLYARNILAMLDNIIDKEGGLVIDMEDDVTGPTSLTHDGQIIHGPTKERLGG